MTYSSHGLREREEDVFFEYVADGLVISRCQNGVDHVHIDFEVVVVGEVVAHESVDVGGCIAVGIESLIAHVYL